MSRPPRRLLPFACVGAVVAALLGSGQQAPLPRPPDLDAAMHHLGNDRMPAWSEATADPEKQPLVVAFESKRNETEWTLEATARDVDDDWAVELNGKRLGLLKRFNDELRITRFRVPEGWVVAGRNELKLAPRDANEDITVGRFRLLDRELREVLELGGIDVAVTDAATRRPLPARVTVTDEDGRPVELHYAAAPTTAVRDGIAYTGAGAAHVELPAGRYVVWASRGMEWSCAKAEVEVAARSKRQVALALEREVDTRGWIAADTHVHTLTYSGHGDSSVEERVVTLAGEGIELAVATDHNHHTDYRPVQQQLALTPWFTPVIGNEVTSDNGHMNAFPLPPGSDVPPSKEPDWAKLVAGIRAKGAQVVILNHPRWPEKGKDPLTSFGFVDASGERRTGQKFTFDCLELVNSDAPTQPWEVVLPVWFGLLNRGERFPGVGASDSHHVGVIVGQGRTYVPSATDDPAAIDVDDACRKLKEGRASVSLGLFATIDVDGRGMGDTIDVAGEEIVARVAVRHPSWCSPERIDLVVDGAVVASEPLGASRDGDAPCALERRVTARLPAHDCWLVAVVRGAKVTAPFWAMSQPAAVAITNPIYLDRDGQPGWSSPRATAERLVARASTAGGAEGGGATSLAARLPAELARVDDGVAIQALELARDALRRAAQADLEAIAAGSGAGRAALADWAKTQR
jgi:hypothetical protein